MKKLIGAALVAVGIGLSASASQAMWGNFFGTYEDSNGDAFADGSALLYVLSDSSKIVEFDGSAWKLNGATLVATAAYSSADEGWGSLDYVDLGSAVDATGAEMQYFQLIITENAGVSTIDGYDGNYVSWTQQGSQEVVDPTGPTYGVDVTMYNDIAKADWQSASVPEPTSGLLMLLGMAGLALRRRRA